MSIYTTITSCRSCQSKDIKDILDLGNQYLSAFVDSEETPKSPLVLIICENCKLVQLKHTTNSDLLYTDNYGYMSGINQTMKDELKDVVDKALKISSVQNGDVVLDIGANDGSLLSNYNNNVLRVACEPIKKFRKLLVKYADVIMGDFFSASLYLKHSVTKPKVITAISCFYDLDDPNTFVQGIKEILDENGVFVVQQNYLFEMIKNRAFDNIVHEHLEYYSLESLTNLLDRHNLEVFDVELRNINGGSFRTYIRHKGGLPFRAGGEERIKKLKTIEYQHRLEDFNTYVFFETEINQIKNRVFDLIKKEVKGGKKVYIYGASTRGSVILQYFDLNAETITAAAERNEEKWGKKTAGTNIPIVSEDEARRANPDYFLCLPWFFKDEFIKREVKYLDKGGTLIFPLPKPVLVTKDGEVDL